MAEFTIPKRHIVKRTGEPGCEPIYSTLSKKPADLKTTDIDLSAIRVFLVDGSHRTISSTPETTCGEILDRLLGKLGLIERRTEYALQIKYTFSEPRIPEDDEQISKLNIRVWDSVDRIYLCKKDIENFQAPPRLRKRLTSFDGVVEQRYSLHDNCAVIDKYMVETDAMHAQQPVLVNEQLASRFARAWSVGSEKQQAGESGGQKPMTNTVVFRPARICPEEAKPKVSPKMKRRNTYTQECRPKDSTIRRPPPVSPRREPESSPKRRVKSQGDVSKERNALTASSLHLPTCSKPPPIPFIIPERVSAYLHNCTISDKELLKQGKRMSQMLQLTPKKEAQESKPLRTLQVAFSRFGTLLRKGRYSSDSSLSPSPTSKKKGLGFPDSPVLRLQETHALEHGVDSPPKKPAENVTNSMGVRMSLDEDDQVYMANQNPGLDCPKGKTVPRQKVPIVSRRRTIIEEYDIAVPIRMPPREHNYLTALIDNPPTLQPL